MHAPFLILETGQPIASLRRHGSFAHWVRVASGLGRDDAIAIDVEGGDALPGHEGWAGVLVTGSAAMVTEQLDWSVATAAWLRQAVDRALPVFGICYGHQLLAHALGGEVGPNPAGRQMGTIEVTLTEAAADDVLFRGLPPRFRAQATHLQSVLVPPPDAVVLARADRDPCHAFRVGPSAWGVQFHPEFPAAVMRGYVQARADALQAEGQCPQQLSRTIAATPRAREVLRRFVRHTRGAARG
ncbi:MAG: glutamine amidotransferase [Pseudoxanthomonas suwonensis]|nr:glutamine amidotransferase [Pseudoxanthomonas suwonensis]